MLKEKRNIVKKMILRYKIKEFIAILKYELNMKVIKTSYNF